MNSKVSDESVPYLKGALRAWEIMRIPYMAASFAGYFFFVWLFVPGLPALLSAEFLKLLSSPIAWCVVSASILTANVLYCVGPLLECGLFVFYGVRLGRYRYALCAVGTALMAVIAFPGSYLLVLFLLSGGVSKP